MLSQFLAIKYTTIKNTHNNSQLDSQEHLSAKIGLTNIKAMGVLSHIFLLVASAFQMFAKLSSQLKTVKKINKMMDNLTPQ